MTLQPGARLSHYEISSLLGAGGMGEVYRAKDHKLGRDVAIKVLREELASDPERLRRFEQEARSASALNHPNIITIHDIRLRHEHDGLPAVAFHLRRGFGGRVAKAGGQVGNGEDVDFIVMEFVEGKTLRQVLSEGPLPTKKLLQLATQIAEGLAKAHSAGIIHRDLKPENLMVTSDGYVKILDFGLAKLRTSPRDMGSEMATVTKEGTAQGTVLGTVGYMSPEQAKGQFADYRSDQFSLGAILYEMVTGERAFQRDSSVQTLSSIIEREPVSITALNPETPPHLRATVERCLSKNPEERYDSTRDLSRELKSIGEVATPKPSEATVAPSKKRRTWPRFVAIAGGMAAVLAIALTLNVGGLRDRLIGEPNAPPIDSIAVLPLENLSGDPEQEYFADGMTDALITDLSKIEALKVISRTSAMLYKETDEPIPRIAQQLNVEGIVEGSVLRVGNRVRITVQLIEAATDQSLWAESYERDLSDILSLQSEVAREVASKVRIVLTPVEGERLARSRPINPAAHEAYLRGRHHWNRRTPADLMRAIEYFQRAIDADPDFALAYADMGHSFAALGGPIGNLFPPLQAMEKSKAAANKAIAIDPELAEGYLTLAFVLSWYEWDWSGAENAIRMAIELKPGYAFARNTLADHLSRMARHREALAEMERALDFDPLNLTLNSVYGLLLYHARRNDQAINRLLATLEMDRSFPFAHRILGFCYVATERYEEAIREHKEAVALAGSRSIIDLSSLGAAYAAAGERAAAMRILQDLEERSKQEYVPAFSRVPIYSRLGSIDKAFVWLERAFDEHSSFVSYLKVQPAFDPLRNDPRFQDLLRRMNFPE